MAVRRPDDGEREAAWLRRREAAAAHAGVLSGADRLYRAGEVLVETRIHDCADADAARRLEDAGAALDQRTERLDALGLHLWRMDERAQLADLPGLARGLRHANPSDRPPRRVEPNIVLTGEGHYQGGPGGPPRPASRLSDPSAPRTPPGAPALSVLDTGPSVDLPGMYPGLRAWITRDAGDPDDVDLLDSDGSPGLDTEAGHGTFICGLVQRSSPGLVVDAPRVLSPSGWGTDVDVALGLLDAEAPVLNLSLGGYTRDDRAPVALQRALQALGRERVVVAAAGNNASDRPFWPAALKNVVAVAALDTTAGEPRAAAFSNHGPWVDACAPGVDLHSAYVKGTMDVGHAQDFDGWARWSGTSFAAPLVAAALARRVADGEPPRAALRLLADLEPRPGLEDFGGWFDPGVDLLCRDDR